MCRYNVKTYCVVFPVWLDACVIERECFQCESKFMMNLPKAHETYTA